MSKDAGSIVGAIVVILLFSVGIFQLIGHWIWLVIPVFIGLCILLSRLHNRLDSITIEDMDRAAEEYREGVDREIARALGQKPQQRTKESTSKQEQEKRMNPKQIEKERRNWLKMSYLAETSNTSVKWHMEGLESEKFMHHHVRGTFPNEARHFELLGLIKSSRANGDNEKCEKYCLEDIALYPVYIEEIKQKEEKRIEIAKAELADISAGRKSASQNYIDLLSGAGQQFIIPTRFSSFETLAKLYQKQGRFAEALEICEKALGYGIRDGTKGGFIERKRRLINLQNALNADNSLDFIKDGFAFEEFVCGILIRNGYKAEVSPKSGDFGMDVIAEKDDIRYAVQCKFSSSPVGLKAVQEVFTALPHYKCNIGVVAASNIFTKSAKELADSTGVWLWDRSKILELAQLDNNIDLEYNRKTEI